MKKKTHSTGKENTSELETKKEGATTDTRHKHWKKNNGNDKNVPADDTGICQPPTGNTRYPAADGDVAPLGYQ